MALGAIVTDLLAQFDFLQLADEPGGENKRDEERRHRRINDAEALIAEDVQKRKLSM